MLSCEKHVYQRKSIKFELVTVVCNVTLKRVAYGHAPLVKRYSTNES